MKAIEVKLYQFKKEESFKYFAWKKEEEKKRRKMRKLKMQLRYN
jgi:hypothetical protein